MIDVPTDLFASRIAAAIGLPARARMLFTLASGRERTSTELALIADVTPSTASVHLRSLRQLRLVQVVPKGKHRYYRLAGHRVNAALEALSVLAGGSRDAGVLTTVQHLRQARTCYDHLAGALGVALFARFITVGWLSQRKSGRAKMVDVTPVGVSGLAALGINLESVRRVRRKFAYACLDWSEQKPHLGGALGCALLEVSERKRWVSRNADSRALSITGVGRRELWGRFGILV
ncbi:MAG TPA: helix-turn-helix transcriptional regulator [Gemmatimonadaceae bacterium]|nr:helix-turn-helix transcriptional regulator [Gemmatimonadaceae bacterium]